mmetsp:Transcript_85438/g.227807  ORF Transcript_85438/g.227807 Transcript_85438/m.227807 type:complete len:90 (+) Transcript_85438:47-316(+)
MVDAARDDVGRTGFETAGARKKARNIAGDLFWTRFAVFTRDGPREDLLYRHFQTSRGRRKLDWRAAGSRPSSRDARPVCRLASRGLVGF